MSAEPTSVEYADPDERMCALEEDNATLRAMLQRSASATGAYRDASASEKLSIINEKLSEELRTERERRCRSEAMLSQLKDQNEVANHRKDAELRKTADALKKARAEIDELKRRERETEQESDALRRQVAQMKETLRVHKLNSDGTKAGAGTQVAPPSEPNARAPVKPFSTLLRSVSPAASKPGTRQITPRVTKQQPHDATAPTRKGTYSTADPLRQAPGTAPRTASKSPAPARRAGSALPDFKIGSKVVWRTQSGTVRYIGIVHCLGSGTWYGIELGAPGNGEHNGTLSGVKYFSTVGKTGVFCKLAELTAPRAPPRARSTSPDREMTTGRRSTSVSTTMSRKPASKPVGKPAATAVTPKRKPAAKSSSASKPVDESKSADEAPAAEATSEEAPATETKQESPAAAAEEAPATEAKPEETPTAQVAPAAEDKPADEKPAADEAPAPEAPVDEAMPTDETLAAADVPAAAKPEETPGSVDTKEGPTSEAKSAGETPPADAPAAEVEEALVTAAEAEAVAADDAPAIATKDESPAAGAEEETPADEDKPADETPADEAPASEAADEAKPEKTTAGADDEALAPAAAATEEAPTAPEEADATSS